MERKEPTLSGGVGSDREESNFRRSNSDYDDTRSSRGNTQYAPAPSSSSIPAIALVLGIIGVGGAGFLGWQLMEAQAMLEKDSARIQQLENQLNVASTESTQSVAALGINLQKVDTDLKKTQENLRKLTSDQNDKAAALSKAIDGTKAEINNVKSDANTTKQDVLAQKASIGALEELAPRVDTSEKALLEQRKKLQDVSASVTAMLSQVKSAEGLAARITKNEEAIDAIDDNRRTINKDLLQIKQQLGIKN